MDESLKDPLFLAHSAVFNSCIAGAELCHLLLIFANNWDHDSNANPDLDTIIVFLKDISLMSLSYKKSDTQHAKALRQIVNIFVFLAAKET